jgi:hypothetical protein
LSFIGAGELHLAFGGEAKAGASDDWNTLGYSTSRAATGFTKEAVQLVDASLRVANDR